MPQYTYQCECGEIIERINPMSEVKAKVRCPKCKKMAGRKWEVPNFKCVYSYMDRVQGNPRFHRGKGIRKGD
jgi:putative FmdB family regulatory protein